MPNTQKVPNRIRGTKKIMNRTSNKISEKRKNTICNIIAGNLEHSKKYHTEKTHTLQSHAKKNNIRESGLNR